MAEGCDGGRIGVLERSFEMVGGMLDSRRRKGQGWRPEESAVASGDHE